MCSLPVLMWGSCCSAMFSRSLFLGLFFFFLPIALSVLRFTASDYPFGIFKICIENLKKSKKTSVNSTTPSPQHMQNMWNNFQDNNFFNSQYDLNECVYSTVIAKTINFVIYLKCTLLNANTCLLLVLNANIESIDLDEQLKLPK